MSISLLLEMAVSGDPDRLAVVSGDVRLTTQELSDLADGGAGVIEASGCEHVAYVGAGGRCSRCCCSPRPAPAAPSPRSTTGCPPTASRR